MLAVEWGSIVWTSNKMVAVYIAVGIVAVVVTTCIILRKVVRTRLKVAKTIKLDPDIHDWLVAFSWSQKILYMPTIFASLLASVVLFMKERGWLPDSITPEIVGGVFFGILFLNFLVEEFELNIKVLLIGTLALGLLFLWLYLLGWVVSFLRLFRHLAISMNATGYLLIAIIGLLTVFISWVRGLFYYVVFTPNYLNLQEGLTETGEQIGREDYNTRVDTSDFLERLMGFGKIIITFKDQKRQPIVLLVWRIKKKARLLEAVRGKFAIDRNTQASIP